ncbi:MAG: hypothetical protein EBR06_03145 [Acidimicrobiia bacterium]|nr:hypothetical protein [Acidimicrobiia bacterium]
MSRGPRRGPRRQERSGNRPTRHRNGNPTPRSRDNDRTLGGEQIEGRQAVRELLVASRRQVREILVADDSERNPIIAEIVDLARSQRVVVRGRTVPVHCVAFGDRDAATQLEAISRATGGQFRFVPISGVSP